MNPSGDPKWQEENCFIVYPTTAYIIGNIDHLSVGGASVYPLVVRESDGESSVFFVLETKI